MLQCTRQSQPVPKSGILTSKFLPPHSSWGESAGAMSVGYQLVIHDGNPQDLFHGAFMVRLLARNLLTWERL